MSHVILTRFDLSQIATHHFHVSPDGKRVEERWAPEAEITPDDCHASLRPALLDALYRPKKPRIERLAEIAGLLRHKPLFSRFSSAARANREALKAEQSGIWDKQKSSDNLLHKLSQDSQMSDDQIVSFAHVCGVDVEILRQGREIQFEGEFLEQGTEVHTVTESLGEIEMRSYKVAHHRVLLDSAGNRIMHLCEAQSGEGKRGLMVDSAHIPGLRARQNTNDNVGVFFSKEAALRQARKIQASRKEAMERLSRTIESFAGSSPKMKAVPQADLSVGRLETAAA